MSSKNPYELRFDLLQYARMCLMEKFLEEKDMKNPFVKPEFPTTEQIFALAEEYKSFIERK